MTFADNNEDGGDGDDEADTDAVLAVIEVVNGVSTGATPDEHVEASPSNGTLTFTIDSEDEDQVIPVVFLETEDDSTLELDADNAPTEAFGIGGEKSWIPEEASNGNFVDETVTSVDKDANYIVAGGDTYYYDDNDVFQIEQTPGTCVQTTQANFESSLSVDDEIDGAYNDDEQFPSTFCLEDLSPSEPQNVDAEPVSDTSVEVTWDDPALGDPDSFNIYRNDEVCTATTDSEFELVGTVPASGDNEFVDEGLTENSTYCYTVTSVDDDEESDLTTTGTADTGDTQTDEADTQDSGLVGPPESLDAAVVEDNGFSGVADTGDVWQIAFDEELAAASAVNGLIRVEDDNGDIATVDCASDGATVDGDPGFSANCSLNDQTVDVNDEEYDAGEVLTVVLEETLLGDRDDVLSTVEYPATITNAANIVDLDNNPWTPAGDPDNVLEVDDDSLATDADDPEFDSASLSAAADDAIVIYDEALDCTTVNADGSDYVVTVEGTEDTVFTAGCAGDTVTLTDVEADDTDEVIISASGTNDVADPAGNEQPDDDSITFDATA